MRRDEPNVQVRMDRMAGGQADPVTASVMPGDPGAFLDTLRATGAGEGEAFTLASQIFGAATIFPLLDLAAVERPMAAFTVEVLDALALADPAMALAGLMTWGT